MKAEILGALLLDLYRVARELPLAEFQRGALDRLREVLPFDAAWWGMSRPDLELHSSYPYNLPPTFVNVWTQHRHGDDLAATVIANPGITVHFDSQAMFNSTGLRELLMAFDIQQALCTLVRNPALNLVTFLSLYRFSGRPPFSAAERHFKQLVMPHLWAAWTANWVAQLASARVHRASSQVAFAITDQQGTLHDAEPRFADLLRREWPGWQGPELPAELRAGLDGGRPVEREHVVAQLYPVRGLFLAELRARSALESLSPRELVIAEHFGRGESYKQVAAALRIAPATVRAHLRAIYFKLGIADKTGLTRILDRRDETASPITPPGQPPADQRRLSP
jgi:DNA-binding CsgD family transcriptional regulator